MERNRDQCRFRPVDWLSHARIRKNQKIVAKKRKFNEESECDMDRGIKREVSILRKRKEKIVGRYIQINSIKSSICHYLLESERAIRGSNFSIILLVFLILTPFTLISGVTSLVINLNAVNTQTRASDSNTNNNNKDSDIKKISVSSRASMGNSSKLMDVDALSYLQRYGYMNETSGNANLISEDSFSEAVMNFQRFAGIPETGIVDGQTVKFMQMPRCGNKDMSGKGENGRRKRRRRKRYALQGSKWRRQELTYRISQYPTKFLHKKHEVDRQIEKAFKIWSQVAPIDFVVKQEGRVHIDIRFASGEHGDGDPFDGPGNTLAHAYFPQYGGDAHFDDQEYWTVDSYSGTNIFQVAAHELGHSLGLGHSSVREALMAPFYQKYKPNFKLHPDDILGIQALYGEKGDEASSTSTTSTTTTTTTTTTESPGGDETVRPSRRPTKRPSVDDDDGWFGFGSSKPADLCQNSAIDAITRTEDGNTYVFKGQYYWQITNEGLANGYPAKISRDWDGLPGNIDAALTWSDGKTFFFKGDKYWRFFNKRREAGYPKQISVGFAGIPNNVDAAFVWSGNGKTYFFKKDKYWRFDSKQEPPVSSQYPKSLRNWSGLPSNGIDAAFKWENGMTYFFKDDTYYRFDDREFEVDASARPSFPRSTAEWWFGCTNSNLPLKRRANEANSSSEGDSTQRDDNPKRPFTVPSESTSFGAPVRPRGNSLSRSIFNSLSALFPSVSSSSSPTSRDELSDRSSSFGSSSSLLDDWSFHHGLGEEVSKQRHKVARSANSPQAGSHLNSKPIYFSSSRGEVPNSDSRWTFPLSSNHHRSGREESLSELKMDPKDLESSSAIESR